MKRKLAIRVDGELIRRARHYAQAREVSLSSLVETSLREMARGSDPSFASRWRGKFKAARREDVRYKALAQKYLDGAGQGRSTEAGV